jgi:hypothetical protein
MSSSADQHHHHQQPDELYTLRTQYMLGHYTAALQEAKQMSRRPISSNALKIEREEYIYRCYIALQQYDKCVGSGDGTSPGTFREREDGGNRNGFTSHHSERRSS